MTIVEISEKKRTWLNHVKSVKVTSGPFHSRGGVTIEVLPPVARRWPNGGIPPATGHPYIQRRPDGGPTVGYRLRPATHIQRRPDVVVLSGMPAIETEAAKGERRSKSVSCWMIWNKRCTTSSMPPCVPHLCSTTLLYGLEALPLKPAHIHILEKTHRKFMRCFQSLPANVAIPSIYIYLLLGELTLEARLHIRTLVFMQSFISDSHSVLYKRMERSENPDGHQEGLN